MFVQVIPLGVRNTVIEYEGNDYLFFSDLAVGSSFFKNGVDITSEVSNISSGLFDTAIIVQGEQIEPIVDNERNVYYRVLQYTTVTTIRPSRT